MTLDPSRYTGRLAHPPPKSGWVELVAYERKSGGWDLFIFEPVGVCPPEWEEHRVDPQHLALGEISGPEQLEEAARLLNAQLGPDYEPVLAHRESVPGKRVEVARGLNYLHKAGCTGYWAQTGADGHSELWARRKDLPLLVRLK